MSAIEHWRHELESRSLADLEYMWELCDNINPHETINGMSADTWVSLIYSILSSKRSQQVNTINITEPTYVTQQELGRKIQQAFVSAARIYTDTSRLQALFILPDNSEYKYQEGYNEIWHYPINGDPKWFVVNHPYSPSDTL